MVAGGVMNGAMVIGRRDLLDANFLQFRGNPILPDFDLFLSLTSHQYSP